MLSAGFVKQVFSPVCWVSSRYSDILRRGIITSMNSGLFPKKVVVTEQEIDLTRLHKKEKEFIAGVLRDAIFRYETFGSARAIFGIAGPSGAGKSFVAAIVRELAQSEKLPFRIETVSIDAFHFPNEYLATHEAGGVNLKEVKGRYDTYDTQLLGSELARFRSGCEVRFSVYSRKVHDPVPNLLKITEPKTLLFLEGLWLLYDRAGWDIVHGELDYVYFLDDELARLRKHTVERHIRGGRTEKDAERFYGENDMENYRLVMQTKKGADQFLSWPQG